MSEKYFKKQQNVYGKFMAQFLENICINRYKGTILTATNIRKLRSYSILSALFSYYAYQIFFLIDYNLVKLKVVCRSPCQLLEVNDNSWMILSRGEIALLVGEIIAYICFIDSSQTFSIKM